MLRGAQGCSGVLGVLRGAAGVLGAEVHGAEVHGAEALGAGCLVLPVRGAPAPQRLIAPLSTPSTPSTLSTSRPSWAGQTKHLAWLDLVGVGQLILVRVEDLHVGARVTQLLLGDFAQRVARLHGVGLSASGRRGRRRSSGLTWMSATMSLLPVGIVLMALQSSFFFASVATVPLEIELPVALLRVAVKFPLRGLNGVCVGLSQSHDYLHLCAPARPHRIFVVGACSALVEESAHDTRHVAGDRSIAIAVEQRAKHAREAAAGEPRSRGVARAPRERPHQHGRGEWKHALHHVLADACLRRRASCDLAAGVLASQHVPQDSVAVVDGRRIAEALRIVDVHCWCVPVESAATRLPRPPSFWTLR